MRNASFLYREWKNLENKPEGRHEAEGNHRFARCWLADTPVLASVTNSAFGSFIRWLA
jgi:hypothetical protein